MEFRGQDSEGAGEILLLGADMSQGGAFLRSDVLLDVGETLRLDFEIPGSDAPLRVQARVAWLRQNAGEGQSPGMGIEFLSMTAESRESLERWLRDNDEG